MSVSRKKSLDSKVTIKIPRPLYNRISKIVAGSGFNSVTDFIVYVLRDLVATGKEIDTPKRIEDTSLSKEEIEAIRKRLKSLGYL
ncbi:MAG: CopG family transcriptional regulator [Candidatus Aminicenantes bacterium]|nr:CopG family transcriptional regulator [Candidatus Aminicenantes bacterium]MDH5466401.1 CopG family transcriptional regulator [Candidatus Aminicenantes bacterium]MDH5704833.1 CopG family transcriptional regulator [Candidatus Aminicenantes bacterium]